MRELKFKVVDKRGSTKDDWVTADVVEINFQTEEVSYFNEYYELDTVSFDECELLQYTGLKDEKCVKMYEGDIVEAVGQEVVKVTEDYRKIKAGIYNFIVFWDESFLGWGFRHPIGSIHTNVSIREYKVIGNVTDNPKLLEDK